MLSKKDNFLETIHHGKPDRFVKQYEYMTMLVGDPVNFYVRGNRYPGMEPLLDRFGTRILWPAGEQGAIPDPHVKVLHDIEEWEDVVKIPDLLANCDQEELWGPFLERAAQVDRNDTLLTMFAPTGIFERMHFLMGFEDTLMNVIMEPELLADLAEALGEYRLNGYKLMIKYVHPDAILFHDDWGAKTQPFMKQEQFQEILKKPFTEGYKYVHDQGVIVIHHSDSFNENIVPDMIDMYIDVWQGTLPTNDIAGLIEKYGDKITFQGGLESSIFDGEETTEEELRAEVRRACFEYGQHGSFIPSITYGGPGCFHPERDAIIDDEIGKCSEEIFGLY